MEQVTVSGWSGFMPATTESEEVPNMSDNQAKPQTFSFEKRMGSAVLRFEVSVQFLGVTPPQPPVACKLGALPGDSGESLWFVSVNGPANTSISTFASYIASAEAADVARFVLPSGCTPCQ